ncbi:NUMOD4 domain-containing protein [Staphylococcus xylosus]|uniref:NUMOD4 domain-containing protein n=1 Tax=Staphylococcus xylosus TaxID=1288 RepID=UPI00195024E9|nr:NUMOD4 domain-containing protein [Staphylococcus xylosus]MBM6637480.1 NUMOD4 motif-containing HNH endonuclease [Staphylococcus xylosus]
MAYEYWTEVKGYEGLYQVSNLGNIKSVDRDINRSTGLMHLKGKPMSQYIGNRGYPKVSLCAGGECKRHLVHRIVATAFLPNPLNKAYVNHIDGNKQNSNLENLEWSTPTENSLHAHKHGLANVGRGEKQHSAKLTVDKVKYIRESSKTVRELSLMFKVSKQAIRDVKMKRSWKHVS